MKYFVYVFDGFEAELFQVVSSTLFNSFGRVSSSDNTWLRFRDVAPRKPYKYVIFGKIVDIYAGISYLNYAKLCQSPKFLKIRLQ